jgi:hypothetical protein
MLRKFDYFEMNEFRIPTGRSRDDKKYLLGTICDHLGISAENEIQHAMVRVFDAMRSLEIPIEENFQKVYLHSGEYTHQDWKVSKLALYLFLINSSTRNPKVADVQLFFFTN